MITAYIVVDLVRDALQEGAHEIIYISLDVKEVFVLIQQAKKKAECIHHGSR